MVLPGRHSQVLWCMYIYIYMCALVALCVYMCPCGRWLAAELPVGQPQVSAHMGWLMAASQTSQLQVSAHRGWLMADLQTSQTQVSPYRRGNRLPMTRSLLYLYIYIYIYIYILEYLAVAARKTKKCVNWCSRNADRGLEIVFRQCFKVL